MKYLVTIANRGLQRCSTCQTWKTLDCFYVETARKPMTLVVGVCQVDRKSRSGRQKQCKECLNALAREARERNRKMSGRDRPCSRLEKESYRWFLKKGLTVKEIAKEHNWSIEHVERELEVG